MKKDFKVLAVNPGSTSTKIAVYEGDILTEEITMRHKKEELEAFDEILSQKDYREDLIIRALEEKGIAISTLDAVVGRGGLIKPLASGTYHINEKMMADLTDPAAANHASSLGGIIAKSIGDAAEVPSFIVDPVVVDERLEIAKITGLKELRRNSIWHALNQKAVARKCAENLGKKYEQCRFVVAHMGGGISVGAHEYGKVIDVTDGLYGEGPMTPERSGALPAVDLVELCFSGKYTKKELRDKLTKRSGMMAHLGTNNFIKIEERILAGDEEAKFALEAMGLQTGKYIGSMFAVLKGRADAIILTGGLAYAKLLTDEIKKYASPLAEVIVFPGEDEMWALCQGALRVLNKEEGAKEYLG